MPVMLVSISVKSEYIQEFKSEYIQEFKSEYIQEFIEATRLNQAASVREPGNLRFDFLQSTEDPNSFLLYEAYASDEAATRHKQTAHYLQWRDTVTPWMAAPRKGTPYRALSPLDQKCGT